MKKFLRSLVLIVCLCTVLLCGCSKGGLEDNPDTNAVVIGNGGYAVVKGDYLYYVNGYLSDYQTSLSNYKKDNVYGKVTYGAIYRTKLVNDRIQKDSDGFLNKTECVVSKVVGFDNGGFYIVGDYIYYGTPYMKKNADGVLQNDRVSFNRIKIDGTGNKEMYVSGEDVSAIDWKVYNYDGNTYLVVVEDGKITSISFSGKKKINKQVLVEEASNYVLNDDVNPKNDYVFYTRSVEDDEKEFNTDGNLICRVGFVSGEKKTFELDKTSTFELKAYTNNSIYYSKTAGDNATMLWTQNANVSLKNDNNKPIRLSDDEYSSYYFIEDVTYSIVAIDSDSNMSLFKNVNGSVEKTVVASSISTVVGVSEGHVYYIDSSTLYRVSLDGGDAETISGIGDAADKSYMLSDATTVDLDGRYVYVFASYTSATTETNDNEETTNITSYYLNRIDTQSDKVGEFVGKMLDEHLPEKPTADEDTGVTPKWVY